MTRPIGEFGLKADPRKLTLAKSEYGQAVKVGHLRPRTQRSLHVSKEVLFDGSFTHLPEIRFVSLNDSLRLINSYDRDGLAKAGPLILKPSCQITSQLFRFQDHYDVNCVMARLRLAQ